MVNWAALAERKYRIKEHEAETARMRSQADMLTAQTGEARAERRFGPGGLRQQEIRVQQRGRELEEEELTRRYPYGVPQKQAETARISATGYAGAAIGGVETAEKGLELKREKFEYGKKFLESGGGAGTDADEVAKIRGKLEQSTVPCPKGFMWNGKQCVPEIG